MAINGEQFLKAIEAIEQEKGISKELVLKALKEAMLKGYKKQIGAREDDTNVFVEIDPNTGAIEMYYTKQVVEEVLEDDFLEITVEDANALAKGKKYKVGDVFVIPSSPDDLTKAVAMSVKTILKQKFAEAEKGILYEAFKDKAGTMITGRVEKADDRGLTINVGKTSVYLPRKHMIGDETFKNGDLIKLYVNSVQDGTKGAQIQVTRAGEGFLKCLFTEEIREIYDGTIVIKDIAREAGERSKVSVFTEDPNIDPAGACIGPNGSRIQKIVGQLGNGSGKEKIDIICYSEIPGLYIMEALKPARVVGVKVNEEEKSAIAIVKDDSFTLAIGRKGANSRLAVKLTHYKIDVKTETDAAEEGIEFDTFEELQAQEEQLKRQRSYEKVAAQYQASQENASVLPGLPEGYVAPQERVYDNELSANKDLDEALVEASEKEELKQEIENVPAPQPVVEEQPKVEEVKVEKKEVKTTTSLEDLEKSLEESKKEEKKTARRSNKKKKDETEEENNKGAIDTSSAERMSIYSEEELREMEEEEAEQEDDYDDDVDYDDYDDYYDDDNR